MNRFHPKSLTRIYISTMSSGTKTAQLKGNINFASPSISSPETQPCPAIKNCNSTSSCTSTLNLRFSTPQVSPAKFIPTLSSSPTVAPSFSKLQTPTGPIAMFAELNNGTTSQDRDVKRKREEDDKKCVDTGNSMSPNTVSNSLSLVRESFIDGYNFALQECLKFVPKRNKTQCIIEMLQVLQKYEKHDE
ncbi:uncharacterized protein LOC107268517 isoform X2 [Cephus cinctus]|uniref:Uncharacterized protein LOC107268517 isoform X2 n=1 Tax=Cephus cinctus TaxID=211228 RepID=A0AAJ7FKX8_CEPCN|nr:uncharacterized protein LOC107268517 isoform X2 [Cephus cinctus]